MKKVAAVGLMACIICSSAPALAFDPVQAEAKLKEFNLDARLHPDAPEPHFGRARVLQELGRSEEAVKEFRLCLLLNPSAGMRRACEREIDYLTLQPPTPPPITITQQDLEKTSARITNQAADRIRLIQSQTSMQLASWARVQPPRPRFTRSTGRHTPARLDWRTQALTDYSRQRCRALAECAESLKSGMTTKPSAIASVYLSPHGTNLYVRNYISLDPVKPEPVQPLVATALSYQDTQKQAKKKK